jgi:hypothetical protein
MSERVQCHCARCTIRGLIGPAVVVTIGVLFLLQEARGGALGFDNTYPLILIVIGAILLASSLAPSAGHVSQAPTPRAPTPPSATPGGSGSSSFPGHGQ